MHVGIIVNPWSMIVKEVPGALTTSRIDIISREIALSWMPQDVIE